MASATFALQESFTDIENSWWYIVLFGGIFSVVASALYVVVLRVCSRLMVWLIILSVWVMLGLLSLYLFIVRRAVLTPTHPDVIWLPLFCVPYLCYERSRHHHTRH